MKCYFQYCVYNKDNACLLGKTEINPYGMCEECLLISLPEPALEAIKEKQLAEMEEKRRRSF